MATNTQRIAALEAWKTTADQRLTALESSNVTLKNDLAALTLAVADHERRIDTLEAAPAPVPVGSYPTATKPLTLVKPPAAVARPTLKVPTADGTFEGKITRLTDVSGVRNPYAKAQPWSKGDTYVALWYIPKVSWPVLRTSDWSQVGSIPDGVDWMGWSNIEPDLMYGVQYNGSGGHVKAWRIGQSSWTAVRTFTGYTQVKFEEGSLSSLDTMALVGDGKDAWVYDPLADRMYPKVALGSGILDAQVSWSGDYLLTCQNASDGAKLWDSITGARILSFVAPATAHNCMARDLAGNDVYVTLSSASPELYRPNGTKVQLAPQPPATHWSGGKRGHISAHNVDRPGYVTLSSNDNSGTTLPGWDEILTLKLDGSGEYERWCQARAMPSTQASGDYKAAPYAQSSRDGTRILFGSTWTNDTAASPVHAYVVNV